MSRKGMVEIRLCVWSFVVKTYISHDYFYYV